MDGFSGYNQIKMASDDMEKATFITPWGTFCYKVLSFNLKNVGATYQRAMVSLLHDMVHKEIEVYVDDMIAKSKTKTGHIEDLQKLFQWLRKFKLRLNLAKCTFGVKSGKLLGFMVSQKGIEVDPDKVRAILEMPVPQTEKEVWGFLGRLNYIAQFISQLMATCEPIAMQKLNSKVEWVLLKSLLENQTLFAKPSYASTPNKGQTPHYVYDCARRVHGMCIRQHAESGRKERAIYYLSKKFTNYEAKYSSLEWTCYALA